MSTPFVTAVAAGTLTVVRVTGTVGRMLPNPKFPNPKSREAAPITGRTLTPAVRERMLAALVRAVAVGTLTVVRVNDFAEVPPTLAKPRLSEAAAVTGRALTPAVSDRMLAPFVTVVAAGTLTEVSDTAFEVAARLPKFGRPKSMAAATVTGSKLMPALRESSCPPLLTTVADGTFTEVSDPVGDVVAPPPPKGNNPMLAMPKFRSIRLRLKGAAAVVGTTLTPDVSERVLTPLVRTVAEGTVTEVSDKEFALIVGTAVVATDRGVPAGKVGTVTEGWTEVSPAAKLDAGREAPDNPEATLGSAATLDKADATADKGTEGAAALSSAVDAFGADTAGVGTMTRGTTLAEVGRETSGLE